MLRMVTKSSILCRVVLKHIKYIIQAKITQEHLEHDRQQFQYEYEIINVYGSWILEYESEEQFRGKGRSEATT